MTQFSSRSASLRVVMFRVAVVYGSYRSDRKGIAVARFLEARLRERGHEATLVDAMEVDLPVLDRMFKEYDEGAAPVAMQRVHETFEGADAFVVVTGEYNHSVQPGTKNLIDHFQSEYFFKPASIVSYSAGRWGGTRVAEHWRSILGELGMVTTSIILNVPNVEDAFEEDGAPKDDAWNRRAGRMLGELEWYADALRRKRSEGNLPF